MHYCISDIHGCFDDFLKLLDIISFNDEDVLYIIGDVIDRGDKPLEIIDYIRHKSNIVLLMGNHELMAFDSLINNPSKRFMSSLWKHNGGDTTFRECLKLSDNDFRSFVDYLKTLSIYQELEVKGEKFLLVHGGINTNYYQDIDECEVEDVLWFRGPYFEKGYQDKTLVMGHMPTKALVPYIEKAILLKDYDKDIYNEEILKESVVKGNNAEIINIPKRIFIDCGKVFGYKLACIRLEDKKEYYI